MTQSSIVVSPRFLQLFVLCHTSSFLIIYDHTISFPKQRHQLTQLSSCDPGATTKSRICSLSCWQPHLQTIYFSKQIHRLTKPCSFDPGATSRTSFGLYFCVLQHSCCCSHHWMERRDKEKEWKGIRRGCRWFALEERAQNSSDSDWSSLSLWD